MASPLTPGEFAEKYLKMRVYIYPPEDGGPDNSALAPSGWHEVSVARYRLTTSNYGATIWADIRKRLKLTTEVTLTTVAGAQIREPLTVDELHWHFRQPWGGKGSPEQVQIVIQTLYRYHKAHFSLNAFLSADFIGLDCNGFVGNYYQRVMEGTPWKNQNNMKDPGPNSFIEELYKLGGPGAVVKKLEDLERSEKYVLAECDPKTGVIADPVKGKKNTYGHVMLTEPGTLKKLAGGAMSLSVSEATHDGGGKLRTGVDYKIHPGKAVHGGVVVFHVERGAPTDTLDVRIANFTKPKSSS